MHPMEIVAILFATFGVVGYAVWRVHDLKTGGKKEMCAHEGLSGSRLVHLYHRKYGKKHGCCGKCDR